MGKNFEYRIRHPTRIPQNEEPVSNVQKPQRTISHSRKKLAHHEPTSLKPAVIRFGEEVTALLKRRPGSGPHFPDLCTVRPGDRATELKLRCEGLRIYGVSLHSYRYAWAERALSCGYPELPQCSSKNLSAPAECKGSILEIICLNFPRGLVVQSSHSK